MAALGQHAPQIVPALPGGRRTTTYALAGIVAGLAVAVGAFVVHGGGDGSLGQDNALRYATLMVFRMSLVAYLLFYLARPLGELLPQNTGLWICRERRGLAFAFVAIYAVFLGCALAADGLSPMHTALPTLVFAGLSAMVLAALVAGERSGSVEDGHWRGALRAMECVGVAYFWIVYAADAFDHISHPHRPDWYFGAALIALALALVLRFAGSFRERLRRAQG
ncbi:MAG: hypothetical protein JO261_03105 [Alphaproteobacteria bacterium]|nr:hypothetical protein [Alphaproteobacteria bacterium]MBV9692668.1 hypothetical protein [Alphaproteobacteria bacterium]